MGQVWGYARVSTEDQELGLQVTALRDAGVPDGNIVQEKASGKAGGDRPLYAKLLGRLQDGDRLVVWKVDRLGRSTLETRSRRLRTWTHWISIVITTLGIDMKAAAGRLVFGMMCQIAEFERELIRERVTAGMADAKRRGKHVGRKYTLTTHQRAEAARLHKQEGKSLGAIAAILGAAGLSCSAPLERPQHDLRNCRDADGTGTVRSQRYADREAALRAAQRSFRRDPLPASVVWLNECGVPKVWVAHVDADGVRLTEFWNI